MRGLVVGWGSIGHRHLQNLKSLGICNLAVVEPHTHQQFSIGNLGGIEVFSSLQKGLEWKPDFVVIASPSQFHIQQALEAANTGCHLFIEKPLSSSLDGVDKLMQAIKQQELITMVACNMRFHPGPIIVKRLIEEDTVGKIIAARIQTGSFLPLWRPQQDYRQSYSSSTEWGGAILDCIHEIDLAIWYFGTARLAAAATIPATAIGLETDGLAEIILFHEHKLLCNVHLNFIQRDYCRTCQIIGTEGTIYWDFKDRRVLVYGAHGHLSQELLEPEGYEINTMYVDELAHFIYCVKNNMPTVNPIEQSLGALKIALEVRTLKGGIFHENISDCSGKDG